MSIFDQLVFVPDGAQLTLVKMIQILISLSFVPYLSLIFAGSIVAMIADAKGRLLGESENVHFASDIVKFISANSGVGVALGLVPCLAMVITHAQILYSSGAPAASIFLGAAVLLTIGFLFLNKFKDAIDICDVVNHEDENSIDLLEAANSTRSFAAPLAALFISAGSFVYIAGISNALDASTWSGFGAILCTYHFWMKFIAFACGSFSILGAALLFSKFLWNGGDQTLTNNYKEILNNRAASMGIVFLPLMLIFSGLYLLSVPANSFSYSVAIYSCISIIVWFVTLHLFQRTLAHKDFKVGGLSFIFFVVGILFSVLADSEIRENGNRAHTHDLVSKADAHSTGH